MYLGWVGHTPAPATPASVAVEGGASVQMLSLNIFTMKVRYQAEKHNKQEGTKRKR